jgi:hypothetical protein
LATIEIGVGVQQPLFSLETTFGAPGPVPQHDGVPWMVPARPPFVLSLVSISLIRFMSITASLEVPAVDE